MKRRYFWIMLSVVLLTCGSAAAQKISTFDAPGAGTGAGQGTLSQGISDLGITYGYYIDGSGVAHGFLRLPGGEFATFDAPGAGTAAGQGTFAFSLNPEGALAGYYIDGNGVLHGYVRTLRGAITTFDAPGAVRVPARARTGSTLIQRELSRDMILTLATWLTLTCAIATVRSP